MSNILNSPVTNTKRKNSNKTDIPFYETPTGKPTSSQIIKEAKEKLNDPQQQQQQQQPQQQVSSGKKLSPSNSVLSNLPQASNYNLRILQTNRPFTPRDPDDKRSLFGTKSNRPVNDRPPSVFDVKSLTDASRPSSGTRLSPIDKKTTEIQRQISLKSQLSNEDNNYNINNINKSIVSINDESNEINHPLLHVERRGSSKAKLLPQLAHSTSISNVSEKQLNDSLSTISTTTTTNNNNNNNNNNTSTITNRSETIVSSSNIITDDNYSIIYECLNERKTSAGKTHGNEEYDPEEEKYWQKVLKPHFNEMIAFHKEKLINEFCKSCNKLYDLLNVKNMLGKSSSKRKNILKILFKFLDTDNDEIKLKLSRVILSFEVSTNNLTNICRLLFSLSRKEENDPLFLQDNLLDLILNSSERLDFKSNSDSIVYFCGALKNLSGNNKLLKELSNRNLVKLLANIARNLSLFYKDNETKKSEAGHALVQLTATLRNLADLPHNREKFINFQIIQELTNALKYFTSDSDLMLNISRIFSKLTLHSDCCTILSECTSCYKSFIKIMIKHDSKQDLIVRTSFILGNLTSRNDIARVKYAEEKHSIETLIRLLKIYIDLDLKSEPVFAEAEENEREPSENEDVMIKLIRVIANLSINEIIGYEIAKNEDCLNILLKILDSKNLKNEELVMNTIVTLNNLSFYDSDLYVNRSIDLINNLMKYLLTNNYEAILEVFRVFANLSRHKIVRNYLVERKVDLMAIALLDSGNHELVYIVIGVLINLMSDDDKREILKKEDGVMKLIEVLSDFGRNDWQIASMVCKVFMNFSEKITSCNTCFGEKQAFLLQNVLYEFLDEEFILHQIKSRPAQQQQINDDLNNTTNMNDYMYNLWLEDFCPVAQRLLERIQAHQSQFETL